MIQVGQVLDKYELLERVGQGGMAVVYRGLDRSLKRVVAVKVLHKHLSEYQEARDRFEREAQAVAKLRHENILEIFDYSGAEAAEAYGGSYIVTEFIDGRTLKQIITDRPFEHPEIGAMSRYPPERSRVAASDTVSPVAASRMGSIDHAALRAISATSASASQGSPRSRASSRADRVAVREASSRGTGLLLVE